jgi:hypothetical protein
MAHRIGKIYRISDVELQRFLANVAVGPDEIKRMREKDTSYSRRQERCLRI